MVKATRVTYRRRHSYNTISNRIRKVKTPGTFQFTRNLISSSIILSFSWFPTQTIPRKSQGRKPNNPFPSAVHCLSSTMPACWWSCARRVVVRFSWCWKWVCSVVFFVCVLSVLFCVCQQNCGAPKRKGGEDVGKSMVVDFVQLLVTRCISSQPLPLTRRTQKDVELKLDVDDAPLFFFLLISLFENHQLTNYFFYIAFHFYFFSPT